jgi:hypothetical protein
MNEVPEWLEDPSKTNVEPDPASYPKGDELTYEAALAWIRDPKNRQWKLSKKAGKQQDFQMMDDLWTKVTGMAIFKKNRNPALRVEICCACEEVLDQNQTHEAVSEAELRKLRMRTRQRLLPHLQGHLIGIDDLTTWIDHFLRIYMPRGVFHWKNQLRNFKSRRGESPLPQAQTASNAPTGSAAPAAPAAPAATVHQKRQGSAEPDKEAKKICINQPAQRYLPLSPLHPFRYQEMLITDCRTSKSIMAAMAAFISPSTLCSDIASSNHLSLELLKQILGEGGDETTFEVWDPDRNTIIKSDFQLANVIGLQWGRIQAGNGHCVFKLEIRPKQ